MLAGDRSLDRVNRKDNQICQNLTNVKFLNLI